MPKIKKPSLRKPTAKSQVYSPIFTRRTKILLFSGLFLMLVPLVFYINQTIQLMFVVPNITDSEKLSHSLQTARPVHVAIPKVQLTLPIEETMIRNHVWSISQTAVSHLTESANPGEGGPIILYAHNTNDRFGPIRWLSNGDKIEVTNANHQTYSYKITERVQTNPDELSVFFKRKSEALYLFTCDGFADLKRYIVIAEPEKTASTAAMPSR